LKATLIHIIFITNLQAYRIISTAFFHLSLMHIAFNSMTLHNVGSVIEARVGTISFALCTLILIPACGVMNVASSLMSNAVGYDQSMKECAAGFSGVLFAYVTIQALHRDGGSYSIYGFFTVPAKWYPLCMLVITQILLPQSSFVGHLGGILAGLMYSVAESRLPSCLPCVTYLENACSCPAVSSRCFFIPIPLPPSPPPMRFVPGVIIGDAFHPHAHAPPQNPHLQPPFEIPADPQPQPSLSWPDRIRSWFPSRCVQPRLATYPGSNM
jgi:membrane associated rhomboid family serine protease